MREDPEGFAAVEPYFTDASWNLLAETSEVIRHLFYFDDMTVFEDCRGILSTETPPDVAAWLRKGCQVIGTIGNIESLVVRRWEEEASINRVLLAPMIKGLKCASNYAPFLSKIESDSRIKAAIKAKRHAAAVSEEFERAYRLAIYSQNVLDSLPGEAVTALLPQHGLGEQLEGLDWERDFLLRSYVYDYGTLLDDNVAHSEPVVEEWFESWNKHYEYGALQWRLQGSEPITYLERYFEWLENAVAAWEPSKANNRRALALLSAAEPSLQKAPTQETVFGWIVSKRDDLARILGRTKKEISCSYGSHSTDVEWQDSLKVWLQQATRFGFDLVLITVDGECDQLTTAERNGNRVIIHRTSGDSIQLVEQSRRESTVWQGHDDKGRSVVVRHLAFVNTSTGQLNDLYGRIQDALADANARVDVFPEDQHDCYVLRSATASDGEITLRYGNGATGQYGVTITSVGGMSVNECLCEDEDGEPVRLLFTQRGKRGRPKVPVRNKTLPA